MPYAICLSDRLITPAGKYYSMTKCRILLIGHGSRSGESAEVLEKTASFMQELSSHPIHHAFLEFTAPSVPEALCALKKTDAEELIVVPMLLAKGTHTEKTIPELLGLPAGEKSGSIRFADGRTVPVRCAEPLGADRRIAEILLQRAEDLSA